MVLICILDHVSPALAGDDLESYVTCPVCNLPAWREHMNWYTSQRQKRCLGCGVLTLGRYHGQPWCFFCWDKGLPAGQLPPNLSPEQCKNYARYKGKRRPKCGCRPCWEKYQRKVLCNNSVNAGTNG